jgi:hypothetical protein
MRRIRHVNANVVVVVVVVVAGARVGVCVIRLLAYY